MSDEYLVHTLVEDLNLLGCPWDTQNDVDTAVYSEATRAAFAKVIGEKARGSDPLANLFGTLFSEDKAGRVFYERPRGYGRSGSIRD